MVHTTVYHSFQVLPHIATSLVVWPYFSLDIEREGSALNAVFDRYRKTTFFSFLSSFKGQCQ